MPTESEITEAQITEALRPVQDPELRRSIVDLEMVREIQIDGGAVSITVALTVPGCPLKTEITNRVTQAVEVLPGVESVNVELTVMTDEQRSALRDKLGATSARAAASEHDQWTELDEPPTAPFMRPGSRTRVILMASGKGGVGKSSVAANTAVALTKLGKQVAVLDADVYGFSIPKIFGITEKPVVLDGEGEGGNPLIVPPVAFDVSVLSAGYFIDDDRAFVWRGPMLHKALEQFLTDVAWGEPDYFLVDMPPGTGDVAISVSEFLPRSEVLIVTTPQPAAQRVAQRTAALAEQVNINVRGVIENMSWFTGDDGKRYELFGSGGGAELAEKLGIPLVGQVPLIPELRAGGDSGVPITVSEPDGEASKAFGEIAQWIVDNGPTKRYRPELRIV